MVTSETSKMCCPAQADVSQLPQRIQKGPEGSKAECTKWQYKKLLADQKSLTAFGFVFSSQKIGVLQPPQASNPLPTVSAAPTASGVQYNSWIHVQQKLSAGLSIILGSSCLHTEWVLLGRLQSGLWRSRRDIVKCHAALWCLLRLFLIQYHRLSLSPCSKQGHCSLKYATLFCHSALLFGDSTCSPFGLKLITVQSLVFMPMPQLFCSPIELHNSNYWFYACLIAHSTA